MRRLAMLCCFVGFAASCSSSHTNTSPSPTVPPVSSPASTGPTSAAVSGKWANPTAAVTLSSSGRFIKQRQGSIWTGDLDGKTTFNAVLRADPKSAGALVGTINEVFTGSVGGIGQGRLFLTEEITDTASGGATVDATIVRGDAGLKGVTGRLHFTGSSDIRGIGDGVYTGTVSH